MGNINYTYQQAHSYRTGRHQSIQSIILHSTDGREEGDIATLTGQTVSVHWYITRTGKIYHFVQDKDTAYHAGHTSKPKWSNDASIGIEQEHFDPGASHAFPNGEDWPDVQIQVAANLVAALMQRHGILDIQSHAAVAFPHGRKQDPHDYPWDKFSRLVHQAMDVEWRFNEL